ncbi:MAG: hypothetical protein HOV92_00500 [Streptomyces sp.]|nr:hypothetical protein [Streptomyces sp.]
MSALPEQYRKYAAPQGQRPVYPAAVELHGEREPSVWVPSNERPGEMVAIPKSYYVQHYEAAPPRDLAPQPLFDPLAQRLVGGGALAAGVGWGGAQLLNAAAGAGTGLLAFVLLFLLARRRPDVRIHQEVHQHASWFGRNDTIM